MISTTRQYLVKSVSFSHTRAARWSRVFATAAFIALGSAMNTSGAGAADSDNAQIRSDATLTRSAVDAQRIKLGLNKSVVVDLPSDAYDISLPIPAWRTR